MLFSIGFLTLYLFVFLLLLLLWVFRAPPESSAAQEFPPVSILIAARNEQEHILTCLAAIDRLAYPKDKLEVLVGDDRSQDNTRSLVEQYSLGKPYVTCVPISYDMAGTKGKANVLAQLAKKATSEFFFITDADIEVPPQWVHTLLQRLTPTTGIVTGITTTKGHSLFERLQALDWLYNLGLMQVVADRGVSVSTMGNNMLVTREAYEQVGGFEGIPFSITEDVQLHKEITAAGFQTAHVYSPSALALSKPIGNLNDFFNQRRRWMRGSVKLPWYMLLLFIFHSSYYPVWVPFFLHAGWAVWGGVFAAKLLLQSVFVSFCCQRVHWKVQGRDLFLLELYLLFTSLVLIVYFFLPTKIRWKGRQY
ncbi:glycosyltransferase [Rufibacter quisquiliarum]|uniref:Cellulose synthase/poly-beta-1,6-N-acetylglucosamine synthase-like glycosyltransferase n=1 Tax=Rufibacter quisquiliarum TaxID=1549639 RepID=A0A839GG97_9BACT|nr:glycosyltransferase [Rufibacter quisquiliarum]MBA9077902.1 cellulose synthase/poly-beta-1,6-N-acetylglucosamine synthase-like glycosyltransferase [Rufibacter quisquiliarum]